MKRTISFLLLLLCGYYLQAQDEILTLSKLKQKDISHLFSSKTILAENEDTIVRPEPLGFMGENYQRFYIHYLTVEKCKTDLLCYHITGKTRVKDNMCDFKGEIVLDNITHYNTNENEYADSGFSDTGNIHGHYTFREDETQKGTGVLNGKVSVHYYLKKGIIYYDAYMLIADGYSNCQYEGTWTSYKTGKTKTCNWGDYRIPNSKDLDNGCAEFIPQEKYAKFGWQNYILLFTIPYDDNYEKNPIYIEENREWWK